MTEITRGMAALWWAAGFTGGLCHELLAYAVRKSKEYHP